MLKKLAIIIALSITTIAFSLGGNFYRFNSYENCELTVTNLFGNTYANKYYIEPQDLDYYKLAVYNVDSDGIITTSDEEVLECEQ